MKNATPSGMYGRKSRYSGAAAASSRHAVEGSARSARLLSVVFSNGSLGSDDGEEGNEDAEFGREPEG